MTDQPAVEKQIHPTEFLHYESYPLEGRHRSFTSTELWACEPGQGSTNLYPLIRLFWGKLSAKRMTAIKLTAPESLTLRKGKPDSDEMWEWVERAKLEHKRMGTDWKPQAPAPATEPTPLAPQPAQKLKLQPRKDKCRQGTCQLCDKLKPKRDLKGLDGLKRVCRSCRKALGTPDTVEPTSLEQEVAENFLASSRL